MKDLNQLPEAAQRGLAGLTAGQNLKYRILNEAKQPQHRTHNHAWIPAVCCALVLVIACTVALPGLRTRHAENNGLLIASQPAGQATDTPLLTANGGIVGGSVSSRKSAPSYRSIWESGQNGNFPMVGIQGSYYRMLTTPASVDDSLLGANLGAVEEYTTEPALSGTDVILSNRCPAGTAVYEINSMGGTLVAAQVDGVNRVFQRVGFNNHALNGGEGLSDTLQISGHVTMMELSDVGTVTDPDTITTLMNTLLENATYKSSGSVSGKQSLLLALDNGLTVQLAVKNDRFSACGTWSCPEFFDAFAAAAE